MIMVYIDYHYYLRDIDSSKIYTSLTKSYISRYQPNLINLDLTKQGVSLQKYHMTIRNDSTY